MQFAEMEPEITAPEVISAIETLIRYAKRERGHVQVTVTTVSGEEYVVSITATGHRAIVPDRLRDWYCQN
jgi:predicted alternative tryptophan synthase beta-subunit